MKRLLCVLVPVCVLFVATGCDPTDVPAELKAALTSKALGTGNGDMLQTQQRLQLMDGTCIGDGNQYQYGGDNAYGGTGGSGGNGGAGGQGSGDRLRLRDGSCDDGSGV